MDETDWDAYGTGNYEKCADCMVHSGFEATAVTDIMKRPLKALSVSLRGVKTDGPMAKDISLDGQRPAKYVFSTHVEKMLGEIKETNPKSRTRTEGSGGIAASTLPRGMIVEARATQRRPKRSARPPKGVERAFRFSRGAEQGGQFPRTTRERRDDATQVVLAVWLHARHDGHG